MRAQARAHDEKGEPMDDEDRRLVESANAGHPGAGPFLVSKYASKLLGYAKTIAADLSDIDREYAVAYGIEKALRKIDKYDPERGPLEAWLRPFVRFETMEWRRSKARTLTIDPTMKDGPLGTETAPTHDPNAPASTRLAPVTAALHDALPKLSQFDQEIIGLRDFERLDYNDIAARLEISEDACRQRHKRAKDRLKKLLKADPRAATLTGEDT